MASPNILPALFGLLPVLCWCGLIFGDRSGAILPITHSAKLNLTAPYAKRKMKI